MGIANSNNMGKYWTRPERHRATLKNVQRYIAQDAEKWYVFNTNIEAYSSEKTELAYENNFTPINARGTTITWLGSEGIL